MAEPLIRRERIAIALLQRLTAGCEATVERNRHPVAPSEAPHLGIFDGGHTPSYDDASEVAYTMRVGIDGAVTASSDAALGPAVNALYAQALGAVMADPSLGDLCTEVREVALDVRVAPVAESELPFAEFTLDLEVTFRTPDGDPAG